MSTTLRILLTSVLLAFSTASCGAMLDTAYSLGGNEYHESSTDNRPTEHTEEAMEFELATSLELHCFSRTRRIERTSTISKTYEYRGGYTKDAYAGAAIADGLIGAVIAGSLLGICTAEDSDVSCINMLWASPYAVDFIYSLIRRKTVRKPVLVGKTRSQDSLVHSEVPIHEQETSCEEVSTIWLGTASGASREQRLNSGGDARTLNEGAIGMPLMTGAPDAAPSPVPGPPANGSPGKFLALSPELAQIWGGQNNTALWAQQGDGSISRIKVDRCTVLRPFAYSFTSAARDTFNASCPLPAPSSQR